MFSIGASRGPAPILAPNKDHLAASNRQLSTMPFNENLVYNQSKQFPEFKFNQADDIQPSATTVKVHKSQNAHKKSPSKTLKKNISMMEDIDEVGLDASLNEQASYIPETSNDYSTCPLQIKLSTFLSSSFGCSPQGRSISPNNTASPKSSSASPIESLHFTWFSTSRNTMPCVLRNRRPSDCQSEDSFILFANDEDNLDSDCLTDDGEDCDDIDVDNEESCRGLFRKMEDMIDTKSGKKRVSFQNADKLCTVHHMITWSFAYRSARKGDWEEYGRDRIRFRDRISNVAPLINNILSPDHRNTVFMHRFAE